MTLAYPLGHVAEMSILVLMVARARRGTTSLNLLGAGLAVFAVTESVYAVAIAEGTYRTGSLLDTGWAIAFALISLAASRVDPREEDAAEPGGGERALSDAEMRVMSQQIYFPFNSAHLTNASRALLLEKAAILKRNPGLTLTLTAVPALMSLPWELLYRRPVFLARQRRTPIVRHLETGSPADWSSGPPGCGARSAPAPTG
mgnify:CR=1 FL=1